MPITIPDVPDTLKAMEQIPIRNPFPGAKAFLVAATPSTQEEAKALASAGYPAGSLVAAEEQSSGRGRFRGRSWESEAGRNLLFTLYLGKVAPPGLPIRIGLALRRAICDYAAPLAPGFGSRLRLKWPNDLMIDDRKAAGILCEAAASGVFAGVGLNCNQDSFPPGLEGRATDDLTVRSRGVQLSRGKYGGPDLRLTALGEASSSSRSRKSNTRLPDDVALPRRSVSANTVCGSAQPSGALGHTQRTDDSMSERRSLAHPVGTQLCSMTT